MGGRLVRGPPLPAARAAATGEGRQAGGGREGSAQRKAPAADRLARGPGRCCGGGLG